jgi:6,7-dimethyl-8-ribityllumazine synthase
MNILILRACFYQSLADSLLEGAVAVLKAENCSYRSIDLPGALEIPPAIARIEDAYPETLRPDGYIALGCVIRGETAHYDIVATQSASGLMYLATKKALAIGNGILTCENYQQAEERADVERKNKGRDAALACLALIGVTDAYANQSP